MTKSYGGVYFVVGGCNKKLLVSPHAALALWPGMVLYFKSQSGHSGGESRRSVAIPTNTLDNRK